MHFSYKNLVLKPIYRILMFIVFCYLHEHLRLRAGQAAVARLGDGLALCGGHGFVVQSCCYYWFIIRCVVVKPKWLL